MHWVMSYWKHRVIVDDSYKMITIKFSVMTLNTTAESHSYLLLCVTVGTDTYKGVCLYMLHTEIKLYFLGLKFSALTELIKLQEKLLKAV